MGYVVAAYLLVAVVFAGYVRTLWGRQRVIADMAEAAGLREERS